MVINNFLFLPRKLSLIFKHWLSNRCLFPFMLISTAFSPFFLSIFFIFLFFLNPDFSKHYITMHKVMSSLNGDNSHPVRLDLREWATFQQGKI